MWRLVLGRQRAPSPAGHVTQSSRGLTTTIWTHLPRSAPLQVPMASTWRADSSDVTSTRHKTHTDTHPLITQHAQKHCSQITVAQYLHTFMLVCMYVTKLYIKEEEGERARHIHLHIICSQVHKYLHILVCINVQNSQNLKCANYPVVGLRKKKLLFFKIKQCMMRSSTLSHIVNKAAAVATPCNTHRGAYSHMHLC